MSIMNKNKMPNIRAMIPTNQGDCSWKPQPMAVPSCFIITKIVVSSMKQAKTPDV